MSALLDAHGNAMSGDAATIARYDLALDRLARFHPDIVGLATELTSADEPAPMALALGAYLQLMATDIAELPAAREAWRAMTALAMNARERAHAAAIGSWLDGEWHHAADQLDELLQRWPTDLLALLFGHQLDFFLGDAASLRDRPARTLRELDAEHPHRGFVNGMLAFGMEESGHYDLARAAGFAALDAHPDDVWAVHAVVHSYEMEGRVDEGIRFLRDREPAWGAGNLFTVHNWWHLALYELEAGRIGEVLAIYDREIHGPASTAIPLELLDASALLWRLRLDDVDLDVDLDATGADRFAALADAWATSWTGEPWYAFNDLHAVMAFAGAGRIADAEAVIDRMERWLETGTGSNVAMTAEIGLPASRAVVAFAEDRYEEVLDALLPIRRRLHHFGGSHAQRDALQRTLLEAALRGGHPDLARALSSERLAVRDTSVYSWIQRARALSALGDHAGTDAALATAESHRARFAAGADAIR